ncbi:UNVERIFIED_CONTAM: hypothetical protein Sindi_0101700 [Sesamum indicum]
MDKDEAVQLIKPFTAEDVKLAMFDIAKDKAPGPDGYSSGFFKAAWPVVGDEVIRVVLDFFTTGRILNPKVHSPITIADFRPISCCDVLYKVIVKLLVQRLSLVLGKLVSPCQTAFIPGRSIGDNIMMALELFTGYNQRCLPPRCVLKVDIRKAYDTMEWDFVQATLLYSGFWLFLCDGLKSIDQDGRFQFHWKCEAAKIFQLGFANDVLLFSRAAVDFVCVFQEGLKCFGDWSGLRFNAQKSHLILSQAAQDIKEELLTMLQLQEGQLPMSYLGLPLISSRLSIAACRPLLNKIESRIVGWEGLDLSYADYYA